jgi:predicted ATPase
VPAVLSYRAWTLWYLGYPNAALADCEHAVKDAREIGQAGTLMYALYHALWPYVCCGNYVVANALVEELFVLADSKAASFWKAQATLYKGLLLGLNGRASDAVQMITVGLTTYRSTGATCFVPTYLAYLARAYAELSQFDEAWRSIADALTAIKMSRERWCEAEVNRIAGEIALMSFDLNVTRAEGYFDRALTIARQQQATSWELRASMSMARLWRDHGKPQQAHKLLAPVYGWFTEGFDTLDLKEAKALLDALSS